MNYLRDNIYDVLTEHSPIVARQWRQNYASPSPTSLAHQEFAAVADYFFNQFTRLQGDHTRVLNCIVGNSRSVDAWMEDFRNVVAPSFVLNARFIFAPVSDLSDTYGEFGRLIGAY